MWREGKGLRSRPALADENPGLLGGGRKAPARESGKDHGRLDVRGVSSSVEEVQGIELRRLIGVQPRRIPIWKDG